MSRMYNIGIEQLFRSRVMAPNTCGYRDVQALIRIQTHLVGADELFHQQYNNNNVRRFIDAW